MRCQYQLINVALLLGQYHLSNVVLQLDPDNPFYLPEHLRDNPKALESVLQSKMSANSSVSSLVSGIPPESITVLLE